MAEEKNTIKKNLNLTSMVGKKLSDNETKNWFSKLGDSPEVDTFGSCFYYNFEKKGISIMFLKSEILDTIFFYAKGSDDFRQYQGVLPFQVTFDLNRKTIESIFGKPESSGVASAIISMYPTNLKELESHIIPQIQTTWTQRFTICILLLQNHNLMKKHT